EDYTPPRPLTHDLIVSIAETLGAKIVRIEVNELREQTYFAKLILERGDETIEIDARPSDAIAVAVSVEPPIPIYVSEEVLNDACK
ncbi:MAG: bifunctional nuclease family protein, partial [Planctomycetota bacterium]